MKVVAIFKMAEKEHSRNIKISNEVNVKLNHTEKTQCYLFIYLWQSSINVCALDFQMILQQVFNQLLINNVYGQ